jgi:hypothetical protein
LLEDKIAQSDRKVTGR